MLISKYKLQKFFLKNISFCGMLVTAAKTLDIDSNVGDCRTKQLPMDIRGCGFEEKINI
jgi:hypothetical protein